MKFHDFIKVSNKNKFSQGSGKNSFESLHVISCMGIYLTLCEFPPSSKLFGESSFETKSAVYRVFLLNQRQ